jgi:hypothetical protein
MIKSTTINTIELIKQWGKDRGITINGTHKGQWYKLVSEYGELCDNLAKGKDIKDDIGDMFVVLVMLYEIAECDIFEALEYAEKDMERSGEYTYFIVANMAYDIYLLAGDFNYNNDPCNFILGLIELAEAQGTTLDECIEVAYADIKDRKGYLTADGVFIKDQS